MYSGGKLMLIDGNSLLFRAFFALPPLRTSEGVYTNAVYGFLNMLLRLIEEEKPTHLAVVFDKGPSFRKDEYVEYKAQRQKTPEELSQQFAILKEILTSMGITFLEMAGFEGDDLLGTLAKEGEGSGLQTIIVTGDRDALQLASPSTSIILTKKGISETAKYDAGKIEEEYGLTPRQMIDLKGLMGDTSDNIPGIPKIGEKTALKLIREFGSLEGVLEHSGEISGKLGENIRNHKEQALLSKKLATIRCDVPIPLTIEDCRRQELDRARVLELFQRYEFKKFLERLELYEPPQEKLKSEGRINFTVIEDQQTAGEVQAKLKRRGEVAFFPLYSQNNLYALAFTDGVDNYYISQRSFKDLYSFVARIMKDASIMKSCHGAKAVLHRLMENGVNLAGLKYDQEVAAYLLNPSENGYPFETIAKEYLKREIQTEEAFFGTGKKRLHPEDFSDVQLAQFGLERARVVADAKKVIMEQLEKNGLLPLFFGIEMPLLEILFQMEKTGVKLDCHKLQLMGEEVGGRIEELQKEIYNLAGSEFNINSTQQLGVVLFEKLNLPVIKKTKTGYSTDVSVLEGLKSAHPIIELLLEYRQLVKLKGTYLDGLQRLVNPKTGRIHTTFNQTVTATGRLSSTEPNLQNIPIRFPEGRKIRQAFTASSPEMVILSADYSQIELRILAHVTRDANLIDAFQKEQDIHTRTASEVLGVEMEKVTKEMRSQAKTVNFGIIYGMSDFRLANEVGIPRSQAKRFIENYFATYSGVKKYITDIIKEAKEKGYVTTLLNRRRYLPEINSRNFTIRQFAERAAINTPIQGTAADIIKLAMVNLASRLRNENLLAVMLLQVHDELILEVARDKLAYTAGIVKEEMEKAFPLAVPLKVELKAGSNWYEVEKIDNLW